jgi:hypothetical protein
MRIIQHVIPLKEDAKPFSQKLRKVHPTQGPFDQEKIEKTLGYKDHLRSSIFFLDEQLSAN